MELDRSSSCQSLQLIDDDDQYRIRTEEKRERGRMILLMLLSFARHLYIEYQDSERHVYSTLLHYLKAF